MSLPNIPTSNDPPTDFVLRVMEQCRTGHLVFPQSQFTVPIEPVTVFKTRYTDLKVLSAGGHSLVFAARSRAARPEFSRSAGDAVAVRLSRSRSRYDRGKKYLSGLSLIDSAVMACHLSQLNSRYGLSLTDHYVELYGYFIVHDGTTIFDDVNDDHLYLKRAWTDQELAVEEMELLDGDWFSLSNNVFRKTDALFLEAVIGEWAANAYLGVTVDDEKNKNEGYKVVPYYRRYRLGMHTFTFPPGLMPVRIDLSSVIYQRNPREGSRASKNNTGNFRRQDPNAYTLSRMFRDESSFNRYSNVVGQVGTSMLAKKAGLFKAMVSYAPRYVDRDAPTDAPVKRYYLDSQ